MVEYRGVGLGSVVGVLAYGVAQCTMDPHVIGCCVETDIVGYFNYHLCQCRVAWVGQCGQGVCVRGFIFGNFCLLVNLFFATIWGRWVYARVHWVSTGLGPRTTYATHSYGNFATGDFNVVGWPFFVVRFTSLFCLVFGATCELRRGHRCP